MSCYEPPQAPATWLAQWIWHTPLDFMDNFHLLARREFDLDEVPSEVSCWISADNIYELYVNGEKIGFGPSPSYPEWQYFDSYDIAEYLQPGTNVIAVRAYNFGPTMASALKQDPGPGGLLIQIEAADKPILCTDADWRVLRDPSREPRTEHISGHRGAFKEICDASREVIGWRDAGFDDTQWPTAHVIGPVGVEPWTNLIPREIPPLRVETILPRDAFYSSCGVTYGPWFGRPEDTIPAAMTWQVDDVEALRRDDDSCATINILRDNIAPSVPHDFAPSILLDFGETTYGYLEIEIADASGGTIEIAYGESHNVTLVDRFIMRSGEQSYRPVERRGGRYVMLTFRDCPAPVQLRSVVFHRRSYPVEYSGEFLCADSLLNRIWDVGRYTVQMCMQDHYEDCPWREQTLYGGDVAVGALLSHYAFGAQDIARKSLRQLARLQYENGLIPTMGPAPRDKGSITEYPAFWLITLADYYQHWGDIDLVRELFTNVTACMNWYADREGDDGLFHNLPDDIPWQFIDNLSNLPRSARLAAENIIVAECLRRASGLADALGEADLAVAWKLRATSIDEAIETHYWRAERRCLIDSLDEGKDTTTQITNGLAVLYDSIPDHSHEMLRVLLDRTAAPPMRAGYMNFYMVEALASSGLYREALDRIREFWGGMIERGATTFWEVFDPETPDGTLPQKLWSLCHEFCSGPVYSLPAHFGGIRALEPGFARVEIAPRMLDLPWLRATVPTPLGDVSINACQTSDGRFADFNIAIPAGMGAEVLVPLPGRDIGTVYVAGEPVPPDAGVDMLFDVHPGLQTTHLEAGGMRLIFAPGAEEIAERITVTSEKYFSSERSLVSDPETEVGGIDRN